MQGFGNMLIGMVRPVSKLLWFTYRIGTFLGHRWSGGLWVFLFSIMIFLKKCMPDYHHIHRELSSREAKYKKVHARVKLCAESIAFFGGGERERQVAMRSFESVQELEWERHYANFKYQIVEDLFRSRIPEVLQWVLRFSYGVSAGGTDAEMVADRGSKVFLGQQRLQEMAAMIFGEMGAIMNLSERFAYLSGKVSRVAELQEVMDELDAALPAGTTVGDRLLTPMPYVDGRLRNSYKPWKQCLVTHPEQIGGQYLPLALPHEQLTQARGVGTAIELRGVDLVTPRGAAIATDVSCTVDKEHPLMVTGKSLSRVAMPIP